MKLKKLLSLALAVVMVCTMGYADTNSQNYGIFDADAELVEYLKPFYHGQKEDYKIFDLNGNNITDDTYLETESYYATGDTESIIKYMIAHVKSISKKTATARAFVTEKTTHFYTMDVTGTVQNNVSPEVYTGDITIIIMGQFTYNPNTLVISNYTGPRGGYFSDTVSGVNVSPGKFTGRGALDGSKTSLSYMGTMSFVGMAGYVPIEFGSYSYSVDVT